MKRLFSIKYTDNAVSFASLVLRVVFGGLIAINHGYGKLMSFGSQSSRFPDFFHIGHSTSMALVIFAEFFCGIFIVLGLFTRFACIPLIIAMGVALTLASNSDVFGKGESSTLYLAAFVALLFIGPGKISLDRFIGK